MSIGTTAERDFVAVFHPRFPAWDEMDGIAFYVSGRDRAHALKRAKRQAWDAGHDGPGRWVCRETSTTTTTDR